MRVKTHISACFENTREQTSPKHSRSHFCQRNFCIHTRHTGAVEHAVKYFVTCRFKFHQRIIKNIIGVTLERIIDFGKRQFHIGFQVGGRRAVQPPGIERARDSAFVCMDDAVGFKADFQAVRFDGFDAESFVERRSAHFHVRLPRTGFSHRVSRNSKGIKTVLAVSFYLTLIKLPFRRENFE